MSNILKSIRLDYYTLKAIYKTLIIVYILAMVLGLFTQPPVIFMVVMIFSSVFSGMIFSISEKNNLSNLYGILPLSKFEAVIGRYLFALFFGIINEIVAGSLAYIISPFAKREMDGITLILALSVSFLYFCMAVGVSFPIYFKFGFSKAYIFTMLPLYIVFISSVLLISKNPGSLNSLEQTIQYFISNPNMIWAAGIGLGLILLGISCPLSLLIYKRNEL